MANLNNLKEANIKNHYGNNYGFKVYFQDKNGLFFGYIYDVDQDHEKLAAIEAKENNLTIVKMVKIEKA